MHPYHLCRDKARERVVQTLTDLTGKPPSQLDWKCGSITISNDKISKTYRLTDLEREARLTGILEELQRVIDGRDIVFGGTLPSGLATPNHQTKLSTEYAGWKKEVEGPARISIAYQDLMEDILDFREEVCNASTDYDFLLLARNYRAYLGSCISIVDAFINWHILRASHDGFQSDPFTKLKSARGMEEKIDFWLQTCSTAGMSTIANRQEWCHFQELRRERNELLHVIDPFSVYSLKGIAKYLNFTQTGIGGFLRMLRSIHQKPSTGFIERLRTAPEVRYDRITLTANEVFPATSPRMRCHDDPGPN